ncbi:hypothetical protein [Sphingomonas sp.]|uniref:hypothetical protein n=1 Tax=Sphingomonas sp. TaxID=28214 RepID=UPI003F71FD20
MTDIIHSHFWRRSEEETLRREYPKGGASRMARLLTNRTMNAIYDRAAQLGLRREARWTPDELAVLCRAYPKLGGGGTARLLPGRTTKAVHSKAQRMGLPCPGSLTGAG